MNYNTEINVHRIKVNVRMMINNKGGELI